MGDARKHNTLFFEHNPADPNWHYIGVVCFSILGVCELAFLEKLRVHKAMTVANNTSLSLFWLFLEFIPVGRVEVSEHTTKPARLQGSYEEAHNVVYFSVS